jgi:hypothetical protein
MMFVFRTLGFSHFTIVFLCKFRTTKITLEMFLDVALIKRPLEEYIVSRIIKVVKRAQAGMLF